MNNYDIADHFALLSKLMDIHGENAFKIKSYSIAAYNIERIPKELFEMDDAELFGTKGIGDAIGKKILELKQSGKMEALEKMLAITPPGILEMMQVKGLGHKKIALLWKELGMESVGELEYACNENRLVTIKGFGLKTQQSILENIAFIRKSQGFHLWAEIVSIANNLVTQLQKAFPKNLFAVTGDIRRQHETAGLIELVTDLDAAEITKQFEQVADVVFEEQPNEILVVRMPAQPAIKFHRASQKGFYKSLFLTTGCDEFIKAFLAKYKLPDEPASEEEIFSQNKLAYIPPALRETEIILQRAADGNLNELITSKDIKAIIHSHSKWSDGTETIETMAKAAMDKGFEYLVISDHSQSAYYAQGLTPERIAAQHQEVDALNEKLAPFKIFKSIESDILNDGSLDYSEDVLKTFDLVIASVHSNLKMTQEKAMNRLLTAVRNPYTNILGHPTGRLLLSREGYPVDHKALIDACAEHKVVIEINAHPRRLDIDWRWIEYAMEKGVLLSIDPDAHSVEGFDDIYYGAMIAQKGGLTAKNNLSSFSLKEFEEFLKSYKSKIA